MNKIFFSVVLPVYNRKSIVTNAIESVLMQCYSNWELLIVDDGSTDATGNICKKYEKSDNRVHYFFKENGGVSSARNYGINFSKGEYILFLDSDDCLTKDALEKLNKAIMKCTDVDLIVFGFNNWIPNKEISESIIERTGIRKIYLPTMIELYPQNSGFLQYFSCNKAYKRQFLIKNKIFFDETKRTWEDGIFVINCLDLANEMLLLPFSLYMLNSGILHLGRHINHLSKKVFLNQILQFISDQTYYKTRFGAEFDFSSDYYVHAKFKILGQLFEKTILKFKNESKSTISKAVKQPIVKYWAKNLKTENENEIKLKQFILDENIDEIYNLYYKSPFKQNVCKIKKLLSIIFTGIHNKLLCKNK